MNHAYFLTGTDTEIGKTFITCALLHRATQRGLRAAGIKPVAAGTDEHAPHARLARKPDDRVGDPSRRPAFGVTVGSAGGEAHYTAARRDAVRGEQRVGPR